MGLGSKVTSTLYISQMRSSRKRDIHMWSPPSMPRQGPTCVGGEGGGGQAGRQAGGKVCDGEMLQEGDGCVC